MAFVSALGGLAIWGIWFATAYALHGAQCAGALGWQGRIGQIAQVALWLAALVAASWFAWKSRRPVKPVVLNDTISRSLNLVAITAVLFTGAAVLVIAPC